MKLTNELKDILHGMVNSVGLLSYCNVLAYPHNYKAIIDNQLAILESLTEDCKFEVGILIKHIRKDFMNDKCDLGKFCYFFDCINSTYLVFNRILYGNILFNIESISDYIRHLATYAPIYNKSLNAEYFAKLIDELQMESARVIIEEQWKTVNASEDGLKSFLEIFDDMFVNCMDKYEDKFFHPLSENDTICRSVKEDNISLANEGKRYIPWENAGHSNRWNPPGVTFLYLSFDTTKKTYNTQINLNEYVCLIETRSKAGENHSFCYFKPTKSGKILDLSYNDKTLRDAQRILTNYEDSATKKIIDELLATPDAEQKYVRAKKLKADIKKKMEKNPIEVKYIEESAAKQYLIMVCNCIYKKVDESDNDKLDIAYQSFRILAEYLISKGVTGIIYPCTRDKKIKGKNLVLFDINDAIPIEDTIKHIVCTEDTFK